MPPPYYDAAVSLSKAFLCFCRAHGCSSCFSHPISVLCSNRTTHKHEIKASRHTDTFSTLAQAAKQPNNKTRFHNISVYRHKHMQSLSSKHALSVCVHTPTSKHACLLLVLCWLESDRTKSLFLERDISERVCAALSHSGRKPTTCWSHWRQRASLQLSQYCLWYSLVLSWPLVVFYNTTHILLYIRKPLARPACCRQVLTRGRWGFRVQEAICGVLVPASLGVANKRWFVWISNYEATYNTCILAENCYFG